ncbi:IS3 family transposase (plasmid) [Bradyrhizobium sp. Pa8]|uniref:IS3 family transposase n=1 Tax=Bradyrhizobium sp. Pa8 TaxID=3386552 RepID=UPI00403F7649
MSTPDRRGMLDRDDMALSIRRQCMLLGIARSGVYRPPRPANDNDLALMRRIDELFTAWPFLGSRRMTAMLKAEGLQVNRKRVQRFMRKMASRRWDQGRTRRGRRRATRSIPICCAT